ncbi:Pyruvate kinase PKM [Lemmus lemmus]
MLRSCHCYDMQSPDSSPGLSVLCKDAVQDAWAKDVELHVDLAMNVGKAQGFFKKKDVLIVLTRWHPGSSFTNTMCVVPVP